MTRALLLSLIVTSSAMAVDIHWWSLESKFSYRDLTRICDTKMSPSRLYLAAEVEGAKVLRASLRTGVSGVLVQSTALSAKELAELQLETVGEGTVWVKRLWLEARTLNWLFFHSGGGLEECIPSSKLSTLGPNTFSYDFVAFDEEAGAETAYVSNLGKFSGRLDNGLAYQASLWFSQSLVRP